MYELSRGNRVRTGAGNRCRQWESVAVYVVDELQIERLRIHASHPALGKSHKRPFPTSTLAIMSNSVNFVKLNGRQTQQIRGELSFTASLAR